MSSGACAMTSKPGWQRGSRRRSADPRTPTEGTPTLRLRVASQYLVTPAGFARGFQHAA